MKKIRPSWRYERQYWQQGITLVAGVDEVGMGALAGPVVAAAVMFDKPQAIPDLRDSKLLTSRQRETIAPIIRETAVAWAVGEASVDEILALNIRRASHVAMQRAVDALTIRAELLLIDGLETQPHPSIPAACLVDGDAKIASIAAASIIAKVHRDELMSELDRAFPLYGFAAHKGYYCATHIAALNEHGPCPHHRAAYAPVKAAIAAHGLTHSTSSGSS